MFCPECGSKNTDDALFCENCGTKLTEGNEQHIPNMDLPNDGFPDEDELIRKPKGKKSLTKSTKIVIAEIAVCVIVVIALFVTYSKMFGAESVARRFMEAELEGDWSTVYSLMDVSASDGDMLTKEAFVTAQEVSGAKGTSKAKIRDVDKVRGDFKDQTVRVKYREDGHTETAKLKLNRSGISWKVEADEYIVDKVSISVPTGAKVSVDKIEITGKVEPSQGEKSDIYTIGPVFGYTHYVEVSSKGMEDTKLIMDLTETPEDKDDLEDDIETIQQGYNEETLKTVTEQATADFKSIIETAWKNGRVSDVKVITGMYNEQKDDTIDEFDYYQRYTVSSNASVKYANMEAVTKTVNDNAETLVEVKLNADYYLKGEWFDSNGETENVLRYIDDNGTWKLYDLDLETVY